MLLQGRHISYEQAGSEVLALPNIITLKNVMLHLGLINLDTQQISGHESCQTTALEFSRIKKLGIMSVGKVLKGDEVLGEDS